jgi:hypothetical protein
MSCSAADDNKGEALTALGAKKWWSAPRIRVLEKRA